MTTHRLAARIRADLADIWGYTAYESGREKIADLLIDAITNRIFLLSGAPHLGQPRDDDLGSGRMSFPIGDYLIVYRVVGGDVQFLRVIPTSNDLPPRPPARWILP